MRDEHVILRERGIKKKQKNAKRSSSSAWWLLYHPRLHYCLSCNFLSSGYHLIMQIRSCAGHLGRLECDAHHHGDGYGDSGPADLSSHRLIWHNPLPCLVSACHDVWWCALFINSTSFSHWFYIIRTFRLALNQCWHSTRGTTLIVRHNNIHLSPFKNLTPFRATIRRIWLQTHSHVTLH